MSRIALRICAEAIVAKKQTHATKTNPKRTYPVEQGLPSAADLAVVAALPGGPVTKSLHALSSAFVDLIAMPAMQARLRELAPDLAHFDGCNVEAGLACAGETGQLIQVAERLENAVSTVRQRIVENNRWLRDFQTHLAHAQQSAAPGSPVALGLAQMAAYHSCGREGNRATHAP